MLVREGNKIRVLLDPVFEADKKEGSDDKITIKKGDIEDILRKVSLGLQNKFQSELSSSKKDKEESYYSYRNEIFGLSKKERVEKWLGNITKEIQNVLNTNNFSDKKPIYSSGSYSFSFGLVDDDGRLESSTINAIDGYIKVVSKIPSVIESSQKESKVNSAVLDKVKAALRKHVSVNQFILFFAITRVENGESDNAVLTLGVTSSEKNMSGVKGVKVGVVQSETLYRYEMSSVSVDLNKVVELELDVPTYFEKLLQLRNKKKFKGNSKIASSVSKLTFLRNKYKVAKSNSKKDDKFNSIIKQIEKEGGYNNVDPRDDMSDKDLEKYIPSLVDNIFDDDLDKLREKIGDEKFKNLANDQREAESLSAKHVIELLKYIKSGVYDGNFLKMYNDNIENIRKKSSGTKSKNSLFKAHKGSRGSDDATVSTKEPEKTKVTAKTKVAQKTVVR